MPNIARAMIHPHTGAPATQKFMLLALRQAKKAFRLNEVPVGAVIVKDGQVIASGYNLTERLHDATQHAEIRAMRQAARRLKSWRLTGCRLYVTLEPCAMCAGAAVWSRIDSIVYSAADPKAGACGSVLNVPGCPGLNHHPKVESGPGAEESREMLQKFFKLLRRKACCIKNAR